jgi:hypothetical protein
MHGIWEFCSQIVLKFEPVNRTLLGQDISAPYGELRGQKPLGFHQCSHGEYGVGILGAVGANTTIYEVYNSLTESAASELG